MGMVPYVKIGFEGFNWPTWACPFDWQNKKLGSLPPSWSFRGTKLKKSQFTTIFFFRASDKNFHKIFFFFQKFYFNKFIFKAFPSITNGL